MSRFLAAILSATIAGLLYVGQEVEAVKIGYTIRKQEETKTQLLDRARALKYNIARLKAPDVLEKKLLNQRIVLESPKSWQTLVLPSSGAAKPETARALFDRHAPFFGKFFLGTAQAEAKES